MNTDRMTALTAALLTLLPQGSSVIDDVVDAVGSDVVQSYYVRPETIFDADSVYDRVVAFIVTNHRLILVYTDTSYEMDTRGELVTTMQSVSLDSIKEHHVIRRRQLHGDDDGALNSVLLRLRWGAAFSQDLQPGACEDPHCMNDHGYLGVITNEDFQLFLETGHDGSYFASGVEFINDIIRILGQRL